MNRRNEIASRLQAAGRTAFPAGDRAKRDRSRERVEKEGNAGVEAIHHMLLVRSAIWKHTNISEDTTVVRFPDGTEVMIDMRDATSDILVGVDKTRGASMPDDLRNQSHGSTEKPNPITFWRRHMTEKEKALVLLEDQDPSISAETRSKKTQGNITWRKSTFLAWTLWRREQIELGKMEGDVRDYVAPWPRKILGEAITSLINVFEYAFSTMKELWGTVYAWLIENASRLLRAPGDESQLKPKQFWVGMFYHEKQLAKLHKRMKAYLKTVEYKKARPLLITQLRWESLNRGEQSLINFWGALGVRADSLKEIRWTDILNKKGKQMRPDGRIACHTPGDWWDPDQCDKAAVLISKDKISEHEFRISPIACNCVLRDDPWGLQKCREADKKDLDSRFCLYHGEADFGALLSYNMLPVTEKSLKKIKSILRVTNHSFRRTVALWIMSYILEHPEGAFSLKLLLQDMGWSASNMMKEYGRLTDVLALVQCTSMFPGAGRIRAARRAVARFPIEYDVGKELVFTKTEQGKDHKKVKLSVLQAVNELRKDLSEAEKGEEVKEALREFQGQERDQRKLREILKEEARALRVEEGLKTVGARAREIEGVDEEESSDSDSDFDVF